MHFQNLLKMHFYNKKYAFLDFPETHFCFNYTLL